MTLKKLLSCLAFMLVTALTFATDPNISVYIDNAAYTSAQIFEFDIMMKATGSTSAFELRTFQSGLFINPAWINGGTLTAQNVSTYTEMDGSGYNGAFQWDATDKLVNCSVNFDVIGPSTCISTTVTSTPIIVTRIRLTNTVDFTCSTPDIKFNYVSNISPLRLRSTFSWREIACTTNYDMFYPGRTYTGNATFNGEVYSSGDADGKSTVSVTGNPGFCFDQLTLTLFMEGFYYGGGQMQASLLNSQITHANAEQADTVTVELRSSIDPNQVINSSKTIVSTTGTAYCMYPTGLNLIGTSYWIAVRHRNAIETWSASPVLLTNRCIYNFSSASSQSYGSNMVDVGTPFSDPPTWAFYSGDISDGGSATVGIQDGIIESQDYGDMENAVNIILSGYVYQDITGDGVVESADYSIMENNVNGIIYSAHP